MQIRSDDAEIYFEVRGRGPAVVLLHAFPLNGGMWNDVAADLESRYTLVIPDLRAHGRSEPGTVAATMARHASDVLRICDELRLGRVTFAGVSIGGYILFEIWRQARERVSALAFCNTRAQADTATARDARMTAIEDVRRRGPEPFLEGMLPKLLGETTVRSRPDIVQRCRQMMTQATAAGIVAAQEGLASRIDSSETLATIDVPVLLLGGDEDTITSPADLEFMRSRLKVAELAVIPKAGHLAVLEQPREAGRLLRQFLDAHR